MPDWFSDAISGIIEETSPLIDDVMTHCQKNCRLVYPASKFNTGGGGSSTGSYFNSGFPGQPRDVLGNPLADGDSISAGSQATESIQLCVFYDERKWFPTSFVFANNADGYAQTYCDRSLTSKLLKCEYIVFDTDIEETYQNRFERAGGPEFCGWNSEHVVIMWKRLGNG
jgi:hypothetical protein